MVIHTIRSLRRMPLAMPLLAVVLVVAAVGLSLGLSFSTRDSMQLVRQIRQRPRQTIARGGDGPGVWSGRISGPEYRASPSGTVGALWASWATYSTGSGRSRTTHTICRLAETGDLTLDDGTGTIAVDFESSHHVTQGDGSLSPSNPNVQLSLGDVERPGFITSHGTAMCPAMAGRTLHEVVVPQGARVEVSGCRRGDVIVPCRAPGDFIALGSAARLRAAWVRTALTPVRVGGSIVAVAALVLAMISLRYLVRADRPRATPESERRP